MVARQVAPPDATHPVGALHRFLAAVVARDVESIVDSYANRDDLVVFVEGPRWLTQGHPAVAKGWRDFCASGLSVRRVEFNDGPRLHGGDDRAELACLTGIVELDIVGPAGEESQVPMRMTWLMARDADRWRIVHEHASQPGSDPYGIGDWLRPEPTP